MARHPRWVSSRWFPWIASAAVLAPLIAAGMLAGDGVVAAFTAVMSLPLLVPFLGGVQDGWRRATLKHAMADLVRRDGWWPSGPDSVNGWVDGIEVRIAFDRGASHPTIGVALVLPADVSVAWRILGPVTKVWIPELDGAFTFSGSESHVLALAGRAKEPLVRLAALRGWIRDGLASWRASRTPADRAGALRMAADAARMARTLSIHDDEIPSILSIASVSDESPLFRLRCLACLVRNFPTHPETIAACESALRAPEPELRVRSAAGLGEPGREALRALLEGVPKHVRAEALAALPADEALARARKLLAGTDADVALEAAARARLPLPVRDLARFLADRRLAEPAVRALEHAEPEEALPLLADRLGSLPEDAARRAIHVLALRGDTRQIEALAKIPRRSLLREEARAAIGSIRARSANAAPGQLAIAAVQSGELSLGERGALTLPRREKVPR